MFHLFPKKQTHARPAFDPEKEEAVIRESICTGEQSLSIVSKTDGSRHEVGLVRDRKDLEAYAREYGFDPDTVERVY